MRMCGLPLAAAAAAAAAALKLFCCIMVVWNRLDRRSPRRSNATLSSWTTKVSRKLQQITQSMYFFNCNQHFGNFEPILVISNHNSFRVLFDKIVSVYFIAALCQLYRHTFVPYRRHQTPPLPRCCPLWVTWSISRADLSVVPSVESFWVYAFHVGRWGRKIDTKII